MNQQPYVSRIRGITRLAARRAGLYLCAFALFATAIVGPLGMFRAAANESAQKQMLCFENGGVQSGFGARVQVEKDVAYRVSFKYKLESGAFADSNGAGIALRMYNGAFNGTLATSYSGGSYALSDTSGYRMYTAELTPGASGWAYPMIYANSGGKNTAKLYVADFTVCKVSDADGTNIATDIVDFRTLDGWYFRDNTTTAGGASLSGTAYASADGKSKLTVLEYDESLFAVPKSKMLHVKNTAGNLTVSQWTGKLTAGEVYTVSFRYSFVKGSLGDTVLANIGKGNFWNGTVQTVDTFTDPADGYQSASFTFTAPEQSGYDIGFKITGEAEFYIADLVIYRSADADKTNLFERTLSQNGVNCFRKAKGAMFTEEAPTIDNCTLAVLDYEEELFKKQTAKMLHITTGAAGFNLAQQLPGGLPGNTTYAFSVKYKIVSGGFTFKVFNGGFWGAKNYTVDTAERESEYQERTFTYTGDGGPIIGLSIPASADVYLTDWSFYRADDPEKTNLLSATCLTASLDGWMTGSNGKITPFTGTAFTNNGYTVQLDEADERLFRYVPPAVVEHKMLYIESTPKVKYKHLGQNVSLTAGRSYTIAFKAKYLKGDIGNAFNLAVMNSWFGKTYFIDNGTGEKALPKTTVDGWNAYEYRFTAPETGEYAVGFTFVLTCRFYLADFVLYEDGDAEKTNLLPAQSVTGDLAGWRSDKTKDLIGHTEFVQEDNAYTVSLLPYDESLFKLDTSPKMLHIDDYGGDAFLGQNVTLNKGVSYTIAFQYRFLKGDIGSGVHIAVQPQLGSGKYRAYHSTQLSDSRAFTAEQVRDDYVTYTFTLEDRTYEGGSYTVNEQDVYGIGLHFTRSVELYLADFVLFETDDPQKTNLLPVKNYGNGLYGWRSDWSTAPGDAQTFTDNGNKYTVTLLPYLASAFEEPPEVIGPHKMVYFQNFSDYHVVCQRIRLKAGSTYCFSVSLASTVQARAMLQHNGARNNVFGNLKPIEDPVVHGDYFTEVFEFTVPAYVGETKVNTNEMFLGIQFPAATSAYIFDAKLWDVADTTEKNLFTNTNFDRGLDDWIITWGAWFIDGRQGTGLKSFELERSFKIEVMDFDEEKFIPYDSDVRINDGVWWTPSDIAPVVRKGTGTVNGVLRNEAGEAIPGASLVLRSASARVTGVTDEKGAFSFNNVPNDFYELYVVDAAGEERFADFAYTLEIGSVITVELTVDSAYAVRADAAVSRGYIRGTLYTPDKKTVADKRVYIRDLGAVKTNENGFFSFPALEEGSYELYCYDEYGNECFLRRVQLGKNTTATLKLKYDPQLVSNGGSVDVVYILMIGGGVLCIGIFAAGFVILQRKKRTASNG